MQGAIFSFWWLRRGATQTFTPPTMPDIPANALAWRGEALRWRGEIVTWR